MLEVGIYDANRAGQAFVLDDLTAAELVLVQLQATALAGLAAATLSEREAKRTRRERDAAEDRARRAFYLVDPDLGVWYGPAGSVVRIDGTPGHRMAVGATAPATAVTIHHSLAPVWVLAAGLHPFAGQADDEQAVAS